MKNLNVFLLAAVVFCFIGCSGCKDNDCHCAYVPTEMSSKGSCRCPEDYYQFGEFSTTCDDADKKGICFKKEENRFLMTHDCKCTTLTAYDTVGFGFGVNGGYNWANKVTGGGTGGHTGDYFIKKPDGNEFYLTWIDPTIYGSLFLDKECSGSYPYNAFGFMKGKFNAENTFCETKIYWKIGSTIVDSCTVQFRK